VIKKKYDKNMQASVEQERGLYYRNEAGIDMSYPHGSKVANLKTLSIINNHSMDNSFNVIVGCKKGSEQKTTFIALKVSENRKKVAPDKRLIYEAALQGMLLTKPNVVRGSKRNGVVKQYVCMDTVKIQRIVILVNRSSIKVQVMKRNKKLRME
jgi:hypothetical protein